MSLLQTEFKYGVYAGGYKSLSPFVLEASTTDSKAPCQPPFRSFKTLINPTSQPLRRSQSNKATKFSKADHQPFSSQSDDFGFTNSQKMIEPRSNSERKRGRAAHRTYIFAIPPRLASLVWSRQHGKGAEAICNRPSAGTEGKYHNLFPSGKWLVHCPVSCRSWHWCELFIGQNAVCTLVGMLC